MVNLKLLFFFLSVLLFESCNESNKIVSSPSISKQINCTDNLCQGIYIGKEFIDGSDIAHQYSNKMSGVVGDKLKELYTTQKYSKVDFQKISMTTEGMGTGNVKFELKVPLIRVETMCEAFTSFDHVGGWNHSPELEKRINQLQTVLLSGDQLDISPLKRTKEGLQEYWIQWRNKETQKHCIGI